MKKMNVLDRLAMRYLDRKFSETRVVSTMRQLGEAVSSPQNYETYSRKGYQKNAMVYVCINKIATAVGGVEWCLYTKKKNEKGERKEIDNHPLLDLMKNPNPMQGQSAFFESWIGYYLLSGNTYIEGVKPFESKPPTELWPARSDRVKIIGGRNGYPAAYEYEANGSKKRFPVDPIKMSSDMLHVKTFNPTNDWYGQSFLQAGASAMDQNNEANNWNLSMLQNSASPSGIFTISVTANNPKGELSKEKYDRLKNEIDESYSGARNAGRPMLGEGGIGWQQMSLSPKDMDFLNNRNVSSEDITRIFGVPAEIVGLGQKTFSNYKEANLAFYLQTVIPHLKTIRYALNKWLAPAFGDDVYLDFNEDDIEVIQQYRMDQFVSLQAVSFLTINEKRSKVKYGEKEGWDVFVVGNQAVESPNDLGTSLIGLDAPTDPAVDDKPDDDGATKPIDGVDPAAAPMANTALNGAQVTSLLEVINNVVTGQLPRQSAVSILMIAFNISADDAESLMGDVGNGFVPDPMGDPASQGSGNEQGNQDVSKETAKEAFRSSALNKGLSEEALSFAEFKSFNPINENERQLSRRQQTARKQRLERSYIVDLREDFNNLAEIYFDVAEKIRNPDNLEYALVKASADFMPVIRKTIAKHDRIIMEEFGQIVMSEGKSCFPNRYEKKANLRYDDYVRKFIAARSGEAIKTIQATNQKSIHTIVKRITQNALMDGTTNVDYAKELLSEFESLSPGRARVIARTETQIASNTASREAVKSLQLPNMEKGWVSSMVGNRRDGGKDGDLPNHQEMNGQWEPLEEKFTVPPDADMDGPGDPSADASQICNCTCAMIYRSRN